LRLSDPARAVAAAALWSLLLLVLLWHGWLPPPRAAPPALIAALAALPLLPVLVLWSVRPRLGLIFGALVGLGYFAHGLTEAIVEPAVRWLGIAEAALVVLLVGALGAATRRERLARRAAPQPE
jgi:uncharacterized membrane protein